MEERTIEDLPEDLIIQCLIRLHYKDILMASLVCRQWFRLTHTRHFYNIRKQLGYTNKLACLFQFSPLQRSKSKSREDWVINVLDPMSQEWNRLPPIPNLINKLTNYTKLASSDGKLVVITRLDSKNSLFVWDFMNQRWWKGKDLPSIRGFDFVVGFDSRIFIGVLSGSVWAYDMGMDEWTELPQMSQKLNWCHELQVIGDELWVINGCTTKDVLLHEEDGAAVELLHEEHGAAIYHLQTGNWRSVEWNIEHPNSSCPYCCTTFELEESLKKLPELNSEIIYNFSRVQLGAQSLVKVTASRAGYGHWKELFFMRSPYGNFERILPISPEFAAYVGSSCCVEV